MHHAAAWQRHCYLEMPRRLAVGHGHPVQKGGGNCVGSRDSRLLPGGRSWMEATRPSLCRGGAEGQVFPPSGARAKLRSSRRFWKGNGGRDDGVVALDLSSAPAPAAFSAVRQHSNPSPPAVTRAAWRMLVLKPRPRRPSEGLASLSHLTSPAAETPSPALAPWCRGELPGRLPSGSSIECLWAGRCHPVMFVERTCNILDCTNAGLIRVMGRADEQTPLCQ